jgi:hypothetical protein
LRGGEDSMLAGAVEPAHWTSRVAEFRSGLIVIGAVADRKFTRWRKSGSAKYSFQDSNTAKPLRHSVAAEN